MIAETNTFFFLFVLIGAASFFAGGYLVAYLVYDGCGRDVNEEKMTRRMMSIAFAILNTTLVVLIVLFDLSKGEMTTEQVCHDVLLVILTLIGYVFIIRWT